MSQDEKLKLEKFTNSLYEQAWLLIIYLLLGEKNEICRTTCKYPMCLENPHTCVCCMLFEGQKKVGKERGSSFPSGVKSEGRVLTFYSIHMHVVWTFQHIPIIIFKKSENNERLTPRASSKNRARLNSSGRVVMGVVWLGGEALQWEGRKLRPDQTVDQFLSQRSAHSSRLCCVWLWSPCSCKWCCCFTFLSQDFPRGSHPSCSDPQGFSSACIAPGHETAL